MKTHIIRMSMLGLFLAVAGAGVASAAPADDSWTDAAKITPSGASSVESTSTLVPDSYEFWKDE